MKQDFDQGTMTAFDITIEMKHKSFYSNSFLALTNIIDDINDIKDDHDDCFHATQILQSKYAKSDVKSIAPSSF
jgi:hypothetical protein